MSLSIDTSSYNKSIAYPVNHGYDLRKSGPSSIVVHSTEGAKGQSLSSAAGYLYNSADVSAHYLIGRAGEVIQFLDPRTYSAWHAGSAQSAYQNQRSIGIECLHASGEDWPAAQKDALTWLVKQLITSYAIPTTAVETHGQIAIEGPYIRKVDPSNWPHQDFIAWRTTLVTKTYRVLGIPVYQQSTRTGPLWGHLQPGEVITIDDPNNGHLADHRGFIRFDPDTLEPL